MEVPVPALALPTAVAHPGAMGAEAERRLTLAGDPVARGAGYRGNGLSDEALQGVERHLPRGVVHGRYVGSGDYESVE